MRKTFAEVYAGRDKLTEGTDENKQHTQLLRRRFNAWVKKEDEITCHRLSNLVIELFNTYDISSIVHHIVEAYSAAEKEILFTYLNEIAEAIDPQIVEHIKVYSRMTREFSINEMASRIITRLKEKKLIDP